MTLLRAASLLAFVAGCSDSESDPSFEAQLAIAAHSTDPALVAIGEPAGGAAITELWANVRRAELIGCAENGGESDPGVPSNHVAAELLPIEVSEGTFCGAALELGRIEAGAGVPDDVVGSVLFLRGTLADGRGLVIRSTFPLTADLAAEDNGFEITRDMPALLLGFDVATWLAGVDLDGVSGDPVTLSASQNAGLLTIIEGQLGRGVALYRDTDASGALEDETVAPVAR